MLILLAEDDPTIAKLLMQLLGKDGYQVDHAKDGEEAMMYFQMNTYELIILDWMMPYLTGIEVCTKLRQSNYTGGILMLTAKDTLDDKVVGLEVGADDYLVKPFEYRELKARIIALARRSDRKIQVDLVTKGLFSINRPLQIAYYNKEIIGLSKREFQLFSLLFENQGNAVPRHLIVDKVWGIDGEISNNNLDTFIKLLRKKLKKYDDRKIIVNVRGIGYKLEVYDV